MISFPPTLSIQSRFVVLILGLTLWLGQYFAINYSRNLNRKRFDFSLYLDSLIPFDPHIFIIYLSTYIFGILPFFIISETKLFLGTMLGYVAITLIGSMVHIIYPSKVTRIEILKPKGFSETLIFWFQKLCKPFDNFPSTHVAFSVLVCGICFISKGPIIGWVCIGWAFLIAISTLVTKQHYLLDIVSGWLLGLIVVFMVFLVM